MTIDRRTLLKAAGSLALLGPAAAAAAAPEKAKWAFLYWIPYDNDLSRFAQPVLDQLQRGAANSSTVVAAHVDTPERASMQRIVFTRAGARSAMAPGHDSSSGEELAQFLEWGAQAVPAENYVIAISATGAASGS